MGTLLDTILKLKIWKDTRGQDLTEYALMAGFLVTVAGALSPAIAGQVSTVFSHVGNSLSLAGGNSGQVQ